MRGRRGEQGLALVMVVVVLVGLLIIATPFAISMRRLESGAFLERELESARAGALVALAAGRRHLEDTHPYYDLDTPWSDDFDELHPLDLEERFTGQLDRNPKGAVRSIRVDDEAGKVHLSTASPWLLANILGGRTSLTAGVDETADSLPVVSEKGFPSTGLLWIDDEVIEYSGMDTGIFEECRRGFASENLILSRARSHEAGTEVLDFRILLLTEYGWRIRPGIFDSYRRVDGIKEIGWFGEMSYTADELDAARPFLTVHGAATAFVSPQEILDATTPSLGRPQLLVADGRLLGPGTILEIEDDSGEKEWAFVTRARPWDGGWRIELLEPLLLRHDDKGSVVRRLRKEPVNVNTAPLRVLVALLKGLGRSPEADVITPTEASKLAVRLGELTGGMDPGMAQVFLIDGVETGDYSMLDLTSAGLHLEDLGRAPSDYTEAELTAHLEGLISHRPARRLSETAAVQIAARIREETPDSHEALRSLLDVAVGEGEIRGEDRDVILRCALDPGDAEIVGGTAPFTYGSRGVFSVHAAASENFPSGKERGRAFVREVVSVAPSGEIAHVYRSQRDFQEAASLGPGLDGWESFPALLSSGPGDGPMPDLGIGGGLGLMFDRPDDESLIGMAESYASALGLGREGVDRAGTLIAGRPGPSPDEQTSFLGPSPVRSSLPNTLHFDEGTAGLLGREPEGMAFHDGPLTLATTGVEPPLVSSAGWMLPFAVEFWFEVQDPEAETILFDGGVGELEDRVLIALVDGELIFRVNDTSIPDFEVEMPEGRTPPAGEIRYAFDDGLSLLPGVPYHLLAYVGGASDDAMALFVDGVPRGQRSFTTFLTEDVSSDAGGSIVSSTSKMDLPVNSTAGFPRQGVLRVGYEILEYIDKDEDSFLITAAGIDDPFGGRGRRGTLASDHEASETVSLLGYSLPLGSTMANQGGGTLAGDLDAFGVAELDPERLGTHTISVVVNVGLGTMTVTIPVGVGLGPDDSTIPVRQAGSAPFGPGTFQSSGGYALLYVDYEGVFGRSFPDPEGGAQEWTFPPDAEDGSVIGGGEVVRYSGFDGQSLTGCSRNFSGIPVSIGPNPSPLLEGEIPHISGRGFFDEARSYITRFDAVLTGSDGDLPEEPRVLVIPLSVGVTGGNLWEDYYPLYDSAPPGLSGFMQIDLDFNEEGGSTEWVRWDTATSEYFVRDEILAIQAVTTLIEAAGLWDPNAATVTEDLVESLRLALDHRGQLGTVDGDHAVGARCLPTHLIAGWDIQLEPVAGLPGRNDAVTLVSPLGEKEWHRVNYAVGPEWNTGWGQAVLVGLRDPVADEFFRTDPGEDGNLATEDIEPLLDVSFDPDSSIRRRVEELQQDSRRFTRFIKAPSRELPSAPISEFSLGQDWSGRLSPGNAVVDELRFHMSSVPGPFLLPMARFSLSEDLEFEEEQVLELRTSSLQLVHTRLADPTMGPDALEILSTLPQGGGLLLVGEEIVSYAGVDPVDSGGVFLTGRGLYGTPRGFHRLDEPVMCLDFWPSSPLSERLSDESGFVPLVDASEFPDGPGLVWVGEELIGYESRDVRGLVMPSIEGKTAVMERGLLRGRYGTVPGEHEAGTIVRWQPQRFRDRALLGHDVPASESGCLTTHALGAFFTDLAIAVDLPDETVGLDVRVVIGQDDSPHVEQGESSNVLEFQSQEIGETTIMGSLSRQGDQMDLYLFTRYLPGAFDSQWYGSHGWKQAPRVHSVVLSSLQPTLILEHEEWR